MTGAGVVPCPWRRSAQGGPMPLAGDRIAAPCSPAQLLDPGTSTRRSHPAGGSRRPWLGEQVCSVSPCTSSFSSDRLDRFPLRRVLDLMLEDRPHRSLSQFVRIPPALPGSWHDSTFHGLESPRIPRRFTAPPVPVCALFIALDLGCAVRVRSRRRGSDGRGRDALHWADVAVYSLEGVKRSPRPGLGGSPSWVMTSCASNRIDGVRVRGSFAGSSPDL